MGEITEGILQGVLCQICGCWIDDEYDGVPRSCDDCSDDMDEYDDDDD